MAIAPLRVLLVLAAILIAGAGIAYYTDFMGTTAPVTSAEAPATGPAPQQAAADAGKEAEASETVAMAELDRAAAGDVVIPAFDLLRAEPDGSLVVAGRAAPGSEVEVVSGSSVLANAKAGPGGDFVAVLDERLNPGEHNIVLRSTSAENVAATSLETAIVSIPSNESGQLVALVQQPGEPSRLITAPTPSAPGGQGAADTRDETAEAQAGDEEAATTAEAPASREDASSGDAAGEELASAGDEAAPADAAVESDGASAAADASDTEETAPAVEEARLSEADGDAAEVTASDSSPFIEAVEIDGRKVFVAGRAEPGRLLRAYANDTLLGQTHVTPDGRFLIEAERELPVGDYIIRADVLGDDGATVIARAAVPFERRSGESIAAVAPETLGQARPQSAGDGEQEASARQGDGAQEPGSPAATRSDVPQEGGAMAAAQGASRQDGVAEVVSPALQSIDGAVIIRRGDTLWHISRRVYGHGIRYTTIYLANQEQIRNPDRIWPGQIFTVPDRTEQGEHADLGAIGDQALTPEEAAAREAAQ